MKFTDGYWMVRKGYEIQNPAEIRDIVTDDASMTVYAATHRIEHKGDTLNGALLKATYSSPMPNVIQVRLNHHKGRVHQGPNFEIHTLPTEVDITVDEDVAVLKSGDLSVRVGRGKSWDVGFYVEDRKVTGSGHRGPGYITDPQDQPFSGNSWSWASVSTYTDLESVSLHS